MSRTRLGVPDPMLERELSDWLHQVRYGPTGWCCPRCGCTKGWRLHRRLRTTQCAGCPLQRSVLSGTAFAHSKLSLVQILDAVRAASRLPSVTQLEEALTSARSTAWHVLHRALAGVAGAFDQPAADPFHLRMAVPLTATGTAGLGEAAPEDLAAAQRARGTHVVPVRVDVVRGLPQLGALGAGAAAVDPCSEHDPEHPAVLGLRAFVEGTLREGRRVSLRWGPRWVAGLVTAWLVGLRRVSADLGAWVRRLASVGHRALGRLGPWAGQVSPPAP